jgi:eukaryotic-like serine/threonine-protein kinase
MSDADPCEAAIFDAALQLSEEQRESYLDQTCGSDHALRQRVKALLRASVATEEFLNAPAAPALMNRDAACVTEKPGDWIGRYKLLQQIGEGGCGVVYMAEQEEPVRRRVALKVIKLGMDTRSVIARFEAERQALAMMDHPNIAKVLDAGATETGRPYFVMELVRGIKITEYCDQLKLSTRERLNLFIAVCQAVQHAHQKGIIHRDLKPSNILVTEHDGAAVPKIIDFGIAKATGGERLTDKTLFTAFEQFIGTPAYTSPEQAGLGGLDIDTRSDIYSLGVLLYELLTGRPPFSPAEFQRLAIDEILRTIREKEPARPSARVTTLNERELTTVAQHRQIEASKLTGVLRGDLDWIVMKCLEKDRTRRYETANGLAADVQRHISNEPVAACPPSTTYRFRKLVRRNKLAFAATTAVATALVIGFGISSWMFLLERKARERAVAAEAEQARLRQQAAIAGTNELRLRLQAEAQEKAAQVEGAKSQQVAQFLQEMLRGVTPSVARGRDTTVLREIVHEAAERVAKETNRHPEVQAKLHMILGDIYYRLDLRESSAAHLRKALDLRSGALGETNSSTIWTMVLLAQSLDHDRSEAEVLCRKAIALWYGQPRTNDYYEAVLVQTLGNILKKKKELPESISLLKQAVKLKKNIYGESSPDVVTAVVALGAAFSDNEEWEAAAEQYQKAITISRSSFKTETLSEAYALWLLAQLKKRQGKFSEAEKIYGNVLAIRRRLMDKDNPEIASTLSDLAHLWIRDGKFSEAEKALAEAWAIVNDRLRENLYVTRKVLTTSQQLYDMWSVIETNKTGLAAEWKRRLTEFNQTHSETFDSR